MRELLRSKPVHPAGALATTAPAMWPEIERESADRCVRTLAAALARYGLDSDRTVAVVSVPTPEALVALAAAGACGARTTLVDPELPDAALTAVLRDLGAAYVLAGGEATLRRVVDLRPELETVELVLALVEPAAGGRPLPALSLTTLLDGEDPGTSSFAGDPGFEIVARDGLRRLWGASDLARRLGELAGRLGLSPSDTVLVRLETRDLHWAPGVGAALAKQSRVVLDPPGTGDLETTLATHKPTIVLVAARELAACRASWEAEVRRRSFLHRRVHDWAVDKGSRAETRPWVRRLADRLVLAAYRDRMGGRIRKVLATGGAIDPGTARFFGAVGLPVEAVAE
ncbi:MAG TPA: AMP-binding protein [Candidatus Polarisedimenticolaceae bacterium]